MSWELMSYGELMSGGTNVLDSSSLARSVKEHGAVVVCLLKAEAFADTMHRLTNSLDHIPKEILQESFKSFLRSFEVYMGRGGPRI